MCTQLGDCIWDTEQVFRLVETGLPLQASTGSFPASPSHFIEKLLHMMCVLVWGWGKQVRKTILHCTCRAIHASSWSGENTAGGGQACWSALDGRGRALGCCSCFREYFEICSIVGEHGAVRVLHLLPRCWNRWAFYAGCDPAGGVAFKEGHNVHVCSLDSRIRNRHTTRDDVGCYT